MFNLGSIKWHGGREGRCGFVASTESRALNGIKQECQIFHFFILYQIYKNLQGREGDQDRGGDPLKLGKGSRLGGGDPT